MIETQAAVKKKICNFRQILINEEVMETETMKKLLKVVDNQFHGTCFKSLLKKFEGLTPGS